MQAPLFLLLLSCLSLPASVIMGPVYNPSTGHYYSLLSANSWSGSQTEALSLGGNLATINDAAENDWVFDTFSAGQRHLWIGLNDTNMDNIYAWVDGTPVSYSNWDSGQPNLGCDRWAIIIRG